MRRNEVRNRNGKVNGRQQEKERGRDPVHAILACLSFRVNALKTNWYFSGVSYFDGLSD